MNVTGRWRYYDRNNALTSEPYFLVELVTESGGHLRSTYTSSDGSYTFTNITTSENFRTRFYAYHSHNNEELKTIVTGGSDVGLESVYCCETELYTPESGTVDMGDWEVLSWDTRNAAYCIVSYLCRAYYFPSDGSHTGPCTVEWDDNSTVWENYDPGGHVYLGADDPCSPHVVLHEYGHNVMWNVYEVWPPDQCPEPHHFWDEEDRCCAWTEGWANAFCLIVSGDPCYKWPDGGYYNLETPSTSMPWGDGVEGRIAGMLWDMFDGSSSYELWDTYTLGFDEIWHLIRNYGPHIVFEDFYWSWREEYPLDDSFVECAFHNTIDYYSPPITPHPLNPTADAVIDTLTPYFETRPFRAGGDGELQSGYQLRVLCDTDGDTIVYNTGFLPSPQTVNTHNYTPGAYNGVDSVTLETRVSQSLQYDKTYRWNVRYRDTGGHWSRWSANDPGRYRYFRTGVRYSLTLTSNPSGSGTIGAMPAPGGDGEYASGTVVTLTANQAAGYSFASWSGDISGSNTTTTVTMNGNKTVTANFTQAGYGLTLTSSPSAGGTIRTNPPPGGDGKYAYGTVVTLTPDPNAGYTFSSWSGDASGSANSTMVTMNGNKSVTANFTQTRYMLMLKSDLPAGGTIGASPAPDSDGRYEYGTVVTLSVNPNAGYTFSNWSGDASGSNSTTTVTMDAHKRCMAVFAPRSGLIVAWGNSDYGQRNLPSANAGFVAIAGGDYHSLGLKADGSIEVWGGDNLFGECNVPLPNTGFTAISAGPMHSLGLKSDGSIRAWGERDHGECSEPSLNTGFAAVAAGLYDSLALKSDGSIWSWGWNIYHQLEVPEPNSGFVAIAAGRDHCLGLKADGTIVPWGRNDKQQWNVPSPNTGFVAIAAGGYHSLGLKFDGSVWAWGDNSCGQRDVPGPNTTGFVAVAAGCYHSLALKSDGSIWSWGRNNSGQRDVPEPNTGFGDLAAGWLHSLGLRVFSTLTLTSNPPEGGTIIPSPSPGANGMYASGTPVTLEAVPNPGYTFASWTGGVTGPNNPTTVTMNGDKSVTANFNALPHYALSLTVIPTGAGTITASPLPGGDGKYLSGTVVTLTAEPNAGYAFIQWSGSISGPNNPTKITIEADKGATAEFATARYTLTLASSPTGGGTITANPLPDGDGKYGYGTVVTLTVNANAGYAFGNWSGDASGSANPTTVTMNGSKSVTASFAVPGSIVPWGANQYEQLNVRAPNAGYVALAAGWDFSLGLRADGSIEGWGDNDSGQCNALWPNSGFVAIAAGQDHSLGLRTDGSIAAWGDNGEGSCIVPLPNTGFVGVAAGGYHSLGLKADGSVRAWGSNLYGQGQEPPENTGFVAIGAGGWHSLGVKADGSISGWGRNNYGQLNVPEPNTGFVFVVGGAYHSLGLKSDGSIVAWGAGGSGQSGGPHCGQSIVPEPNTGFVAVAAGLYHSLGLRSDGSIVTWGAYTSVPSPKTGFVAVAGGSEHSLGLRGVSRTLALTVVNSAYGTVGVIPKLPKYPQGSTAILTARPIEGKAFRDWSIWNDPNRYPDSNYVVVDSNTVLRLTMDHDYAVEAVFKCGSGAGSLLPLIAIGLLGFVLIRRRR